MIIVKNPTKDLGIKILELFPADEDAEYPMGVFFSQCGRTYMTYSDDDNYEKAAFDALVGSHIMFERFNDVMQCVLLIIAGSSMDFCGCKSYREIFESEAHFSWDKCVYDILHEIVRHRLQKFFHYGNGRDGLCVSVDILTQISFPDSALAQNRF